MIGLIINKMEAEEQQDAIRILTTQMQSKKQGEISCLFCRLNL